MNNENNNQNSSVKFGTGVYLSSQEKFNIINMFNKKKAKNKYSSNNQIYEKIGTVFKRSAECVRLTVKGGLEGIKT